MPLPHYLLVDINATNMIARLEALRKQTTQPSFYREVDRGMAWYAFIRDSHVPMLRQRFGHRDFSLLWRMVTIDLIAANRNWHSLKNAFDRYGPGVIFIH